MLLVIDAVCGRNLTFVYTAMAITAVRWYLLVECMEWVSCLALDEQYVRLYCCVRASIWHVLLVLDEIWGRNSILMLCCRNALNNADHCSAWIIVGLMHVWNGCCVGPGRTARTFICSACIWWAWHYDHILHRTPITPSNSSTHTQQCERTACLFRDNTTPVPYVQWTKINKEPSSPLL